MMSDPTIREQAYSLFLVEAKDLLQMIEQNLGTLRFDRTTATIHELRRATHTLKGASASVGLKGVSTIAQGLESAFKALYKSDVEVDAELETLLLQVYESLSAALSPAFAGDACNEAVLLEQTNPILARIKAKLGHHFDSSGLPSSKELGVDVTRSLFEGEVQTRLDRLSEAIQAGNLADLTTTLQAQAEVLSGLAEAQNLPGFGAIARAAIAAVKKHPDCVLEIAPLALADLRQGQAAVLAGDRTSGGTVSDALKQWASAKQRRTTRESNKDATVPPSKRAWSKLLGLLYRPAKPALAPIPEANVTTLVAPSAIAESEDVYRIDASFSDLADCVEGFDSELDLVAIVPAPVQSMSRVKAEMPEATTQPRSGIELERSDLQVLNQAASQLSMLQCQQTYQHEQFQNSRSQWLEQFQSHQLLLKQLHDRLDQLALQSPDSHVDSLQSLIQSALISSEQLATHTTAIEKISHTTQQISTTQDRWLIQLRDRLTQVQTTAIDPVFNRLPALVQHHITTHKQVVELKLLGATTLIDQVFVSVLQDLLSQLIQITFEYGIETPEVRTQQGKPELGTIQIHAYQQGNQTRIEFRDDGQGSELQRDQILAIVQQNAEQWLGKLSLNSEPNRGTTVTVQLPLALITSPLLLCQMEQFTYGLFSQQVERVLSSDRGTIKPSGEQRLFCYHQDEREVEVPLYALSELVSYTSWMVNANACDRKPRNSASVGATSILLFQHLGEWIALEVDRILEEQELVVRSVGTVGDPTSPVATPGYICGFSVLGNGQTFLVIDAPTLIEKSRNSHLTASLTPARSQLGRSDFKQSATPTILVVDDSMTLRHMLTLTLQNAGYTVFQAQDGLDAIEQLQQHPEIQLVTCDVEMPRLDGFEFLTHCRQSTEWNQTPIVMITSQSNEQHQQFALQLGASAYLTKPFVEDTLLDMLNYLLMSQKA